MKPLDHAKKMARELRRLSQVKDFSHSRAQSAMARILGYRDWHHLHAQPNHIEGDIEGRRLRTVQELSIAGCLADHEHIARILFPDPAGEMTDSPALNEKTEIVLTNHERHHLRPMPEDMDNNLLLHPEEREIILSGRTIIPFDHPRLWQLHSKIVWLAQYVLSASLNGNEVMRPLLGYRYVNNSIGERLVMVFRAEHEECWLLAPCVRMIDGDLYAPFDEDADETGTDDDYDIGYNIISDFSVRYPNVVDHDPYLEVPGIEKLEMDNEPLGDILAFATGDYRRQALDTTVTRLGLEAWANEKALNPGEERWQSWLGGARASLRKTLDGRMAPEGDETRAARDEAVEAMWQAAQRFAFDPRLCRSMERMIMSAIAIDFADWLEHVGYRDMNPGALGVLQRMDQVERARPWLHLEDDIGDIVMARRMWEDEPNEEDWGRRKRAPYQTIDPADPATHEHISTLLEDHYPEELGQPRVLGVRMLRVITVEMDGDVAETVELHAEEYDAPVVSLGEIASAIDCNDSDWPTGPDGGSVMPRIAVSFADGVLTTELRFVFPR